MQATAVRPVTWNEVLTEKINARSARIGIVGLGYVGLPLATEFANAGFSVTGIDLHQGKVDQLNQGVSYIQDVDSRQVKHLIKEKRLSASS